MRLFAVVNTRNDEDGSADLKWRTSRRRAMRNMGFAGTVRPLTNGFNMAFNL